MPTYVVTGASRGIGFGFIQNLSSDPANLVIGLVRDKAATEKKVDSEIGKRENLHILYGDLENFASLKSAAAETERLTGGAVDVIIANGALVSAWSGLDPIGELGKYPELLEEDLVKSFNINVVGNIHLFNLFIPMVKKGSIKKVVTISSGMADIPFITENDIDVGAPYSISKAAMNVAVAKYHTQYKSEGILFMALSPGFVNTGSYDDFTPEQFEKLGAMGAKFKKYAPHNEGPSTVEESVRDVLGVVEKATIEKNGGLMVSHLGNTQWL